MSLRAMKGLDTKTTPTTHTTNMQWKKAESSNSRYLKVALGIKKERNTL
jgi:hypothetical protein